MKKILFVLLSSAFALAACQPQRPEQKLLGADRDPHGCIGSAGYTWSQAQKACVRLWEKGIVLAPVENKGQAVLAAYVVFSVDEQTAEVFLPVKTSPLMLSRHGDEWTQQKWKLVRTDTELRLYENEALSYVSAN